MSAETPLNIRIARALQKIEAFEESVKTADSNPITVDYSWVYEADREFATHLISKPHFYLPALASAVYERYKIHHPFSDKTSVEINLVNVFEKREQKIEPSDVYRLCSLIGEIQGLRRRKILIDAKKVCPSCGVVYEFDRQKCDSCRKKLEIEEGSAKIDERIEFFLQLDEDKTYCFMPSHLFKPIYKNGLTVELTGIIKPEFMKNGVVRFAFEVVGIRTLKKEFAEDWTPQSLQDVRNMFPQIVREDESILISILALTSRWNKNKEFWIMGITIQGKSSSGKNYLMANILRPFYILERVAEFSRFTGAFLERFAELHHGNLDNMIIAIPELFSNTPQQLHVILSEGQLKLGVIDKETGEPIEYAVQGRPFLFSTTPKIDFRQDLMNRIITIHLDESDEQTRRIMDFEASLAKNMELLTLITDMVELNSQRLASFFSSLQPYYVIVPYANELVSVFTYLGVELRRDFKKLLSLIMASALLFQHKRPRIHRDNEEILVATEEDYMNLIQVFPQFQTTLTRLSQTEMEVWEAVKQLCEQGATPTVRDITNRLNMKYSQNYVRQVLQKLADYGYVLINEDRRPYTYAPSREPEKINLSDLAPKVAEITREFLRQHGVIYEASETAGDSGGTAS